MEEALGKDQHDTLISMNNLAAVMGNQRMYEDAEQIYRQTLELKEEVLGRDHPDTLGDMSKLAAVFENQGKCKEAEQIYQQTLELNEAEKVPGKEYLDLLSSKNDFTFVSVMLLD